jgi:hypothetical protein
MLEGYKPKCISNASLYHSLEAKILCLPMTNKTNACYCGDKQHWLTQKHYRSPNYLKKDQIRMWFFTGEAPADRKYQIFSQLHARIIINVSLKP